MDDRLLKHHLAQRIDQWLQLHTTGAHLLSKRRARDSKARAAKHGLLTVQRQMIGNFAIMTWASKPAVGMPLSIICAGSRAWVSVSQLSQTHLPRIWRSTVNTPRSYFVYHAPTRFHELAKPGRHGLTGLRHLILYRA